MDYPQEEDVQWDQIGARQAGLRVQPGVNPEKAVHQVHVRQFVVLEEFVFEQIYKLAGVKHAALHSLEIINCKLKSE